MLMLTNEPNVAPFVIGTPQNQSGANSAELSDTPQSPTVVGKMGNLIGLQGSDTAPINLVNEPLIVPANWTPPRPAHTVANPLAQQANAANVEAIKR